MNQPSITRKPSRPVTVWWMSVALVALVAGCTAPPETATEAEPGADTAAAEPAVDVTWIKYPAAQRSDVTDTYHGVTVPDPYRWMEDEASDDTQARGGRARWPCRGRCRPRRRPA